MKYAVENGIINLSQIEEQIEMNKRKELLEKHPYKIWEGKDGKWYTYLPDERRGRILKKKKSKKTIEDDIVEYWRQQMDNPTVKDIYDEWITGKMQREEISKSTKDRYDRQYQECMNVFGKIRIKSITELDIEDFILSIIHEKSLTSKGYSNLRTIIYGVFRRARKKKLVDYNITEVISDIEISKKMFRKSVKPDSLLVFSEDETNRIIDYILKTKPDVIGLGILLLFKTGLRPGELVALKKEDVTDKSVSVKRTEVRYKDENGKEIYEVRDFPKTEAGIRNVIIPKSQAWIIKKILDVNSNSEYLFNRNGERLRTYHFRRRLDTICRNLNIESKSLNKIRKTYGTILIDNNIQDSIIISQMGHTDISTTKQYYYKDRNSIEKKISVIDNIAELG